MLKGEIIRQAELKDLPYIVDLSKKESKALGFIPKMAYESAITGEKTGKRWSNVCNDKLFVCEANGDLVGFCLASFGQWNSQKRQGKIAQICIQSDARLIARGRMLLDAVIDYGKEVHTFGFACGCADDLESNIFWKLMGWQKVGQRRGIGHNNTWVEKKTGRLVNLYRFDLMDLFNTKHK